MQRAVQNNTQVFDDDDFEMHVKIRFRGQHNKFELKTSIEYFKWT